MGLARRMTRGDGERKVIKELRSSNYPQIGFFDAIIPDAVNTTVSGTNIVSIRVQSNNYPIAINSRTAGGGLVLTQTFLGLKKGENGQGVSMTIPYFTNFNGWCQHESAISYGKVPVRSGVLSFGNVKANASSIAGILSCFGFGSSDAVARNDNRSVPNFFRPSLNFTKGGVSNFLAQIRNNRVIDFNVLNNNSFVGFGDNSIINIHKYGEVFTNPNFLHNHYRNSGLEQYGSLTYFESNTNRNKNAEFLLKQRTQYNRKVGL